MKSRTASTIKNSMTGFISQLILIMFSFFTRTFFIKYLGTNNLGYDALFSNILNVLSIVDLGITTALTYALYNPLYNKNYDKVFAIVDYFKKIFIFLGTTLIILSLCISPFVHYFINLSVEYNLQFIRLIFILYALNAFLTYYFVDMRTLLIADQKSYINTSFDACTKIIIKVMQIIILFVFRNYVMYLLIEIILNFIENIILSKKAKRMYRYTSKENKTELTKNEKKNLFSNTVYLSLNKIANTGINSTDNLIISKVIGTTVLGVYSNYNLVIGTGYALIDKIVVGISASLGNLFVENNEKKEEFILYKLQYFNAILSSFTFVFLVMFSQIVINMWLGNNLLLSNSTVFIICFNQYLFMVRKNLDIIMQSKGVFKQVVPIKLVEMIINIVISIILANLISINGVFLGTTISLIFSLVAQVYILFKIIFKINYTKYCKNQIYYLLVNIVVYIIIQYLFRTIIITTFFEFVVMLIGVFILFIILNYLFYRNNVNYIYLINILKSMIKFSK